MELVDVWAGDETIAVLPEDGDDVRGPTVIISAEGGGFRVDAFRWETYWNIGEYAAWSDVLRTVRIVMAWETAASIVVH